MKYYCLRNLSVTARRENETDYLTEVFQLSQFFTLWAQCFELDNFRSLMEFLLLISRLDLALWEESSLLFMSNVFHL